MDPFIGEIRLFGFNYAPIGWFPCDGRALPIAQYSALYALLGTQFGGDGITNFKLPDYRGRVPLSMGQSTGTSNYVMGQFGGGETVALTANNLPAHTHTLMANSTEANTDNPSAAALANARSNTYYAAAPNTPMIAGSIGATGSSAAFSVMEPYLCVNFCIAYEGVFPSRP